jgi:D-alanyl-D-alanine dipeptidase
MRNFFITLLILLHFTGMTQEKTSSEGMQKSNLVPVQQYDSSIRLDIRYATTDNFVKTAVYPEAKAFLQQPAAWSLATANKLLKEEGVGLMVFDGYRPWSVTKLFWDLTPEDKKEFVADPAKGSRHNRGCAVDLTLYDLKTGKEVPMPSEYDEMTERANPDYSGGTAEEIRFRNLLRKAMEANGFTVYPNEWWHFDFNGWENYPIMDLKFSEINPLEGKN